MRLRLHRYQSYLHQVSIHAPWEGCDGHPHAPPAGGDEVSIHAPWEGCDGDGRYCSYHYHRFNSRTLGRVRLSVSEMMMRASSFQFTHPGKGATRPRLFGRGRHPCFNSRTLGRVRLSNHGSARRYSVSIHAPWEGCDLRWSRSFLNIGLVSIHAPWEGCDRCTQAPTARR